MEKLRVIDKILKWFWGVVEKSDKKRMENQVLPEGITAIIDLPYVDDGKKEHLFDVYYPDNKEGKLPTIIDIHGGGLMYAYKELNKNYNYHLAKKGFCVISINYSLCPDYRFPQCLLDTADALRYIANNLSSFPIDEDRIYITGDSAGGFLATHGVLLNNDEELRKVYGIEPIGIDIKGAGITSGMFDLEKTLASFLGAGIFGKGGIKKSKYREVLEFDNILKIDKMPPVFLVTSKEDFIQKATLDFQKKLDKKGIPNKMINYGKSKDGNKLEHVFSVLYPSEYKESIETINAMTDFFLSIK